MKKTKTSKKKLKIPKVKPGNHNLILNIIKMENLYSVYAEMRMMG
jgi:hypothetical protein